MKKYVYLAVILMCVGSYTVLKLWAPSSERPTVNLSLAKPSVPEAALQFNSGQLIEQFCLGETALGLPFYLDVHLFELQGESPEELIAWHLDLLEGPCEEVLITDKRKVYIRRGVRNPARPDTTHGFAALEGERALFLDCYELEGNLYVCTAEAPLATFLEHEKFLRALVLGQ